jgi:hypothetical protein
MCFTDSASALYKLSFIFLSSHCLFLPSASNLRKNILTRINESFTFVSNYRWPFFSVIFAIIPTASLIYRHILKYWQNSTVIHFYQMISKSRSRCGGKPLTKLPSSSWVPYESNASTKVAPMIWVNQWLSSLSYIERCCFKSDVYVYTLPYDTGGLRMPGRKSR